LQQNDVLDLSMSLTYLIKPK